MENYVDFAVQKAVELLAIDSPTGYTAEAEEFVLREFRALGFAAERTAKGGILIDLGGENADDALLLEAHADTLGGMVAQIYVQKYPGEAGGLILISTGGMDEATLKALRRKYRLAPLMLWYMKRCNYEKLKPKLISASLRHIRDETPEEIAYAKDIFETTFRDFTQEKDVHISGLLADLMRQKPVTAADFAALAGRILLILPNQDFFSEKMQKDLIALMHDPKIAYVSGGHLSTVLKTQDYVRVIREFLTETFA